MSNMPQIDSINSLRIEKSRKNPTNVNGLQKTDSQGVEEDFKDSLGGVYLRGFKNKQIMEKDTLYEKPSIMMVNLEFKGFLCLSGTAEDMNEKEGSWGE